MDAMTGNDYIYVGNWVIGAPNTLKETLTTIPADGFKEGTYGIADSALMGFKVLEKVYLPDSVCYIGGAAFQSNEKLFVFQCTDDSLLKKVGMYSFAGCRILKELVLGPKVEVIEEGAFMSCTLLNKTDDDENVLTPKSLVKVGQKAFEGTKLAEKPDESGVIYADKWLVGYAKDATVTSVTLRPDTVGIADYDISLVRESVEILKASGIDHEFRTTVVKELHGEREMEKIGKWLEGEKKYFLQGYKLSDGVIDKSLSAHTPDMMHTLLDTVRVYIPNAQLRGIE
jgi:hypothetical protein